jgi:hypothetical protein
MAERRRGFDEAVTGFRLSPWLAAIDNNPTPSYLSIDLGWFEFFASNCPKSAAFPERRMQNPAATTW